MSNLLSHLFRFHFLVFDILCIFGYSGKVQILSCLFVLNICYLHDVLYVACVDSWRHLLHVYISCFFVRYLFTFCSATRNGE